jgi:hypothetical protein
VTNTTKFAATALAVASLGIVGAAEAATKTKVSISAEEDGFSGAVASSKPKCEADRRVSLYQQKGAKPTTKDPRVGSDLSNDDGDWAIKTGKEGKFYARVKVTKSCTAATSKTVKSES